LLDGKGNAFAHLTLAIAAMHDRVELSVKRKLQQVATNRPHEAISVSQAHP